MVAYITYEMLSFQNNSVSVFIKFCILESAPEVLKQVIDALQVLEIVSPHFHSDLFPTVRDNSAIVFLHLI